MGSIFIKSEIVIIQIFVLSDTNNQVKTKDSFNTI